MSAPAIISGDLTTFKHVPTRKVYQLIVEIPAEAASAAFATLGMPGTVSQIPVAVARLVEDARVKPEQVKERQAFTEMPYAKQAALRCQEPGFQLFLMETGRMAKMLGHVEVEQAAEAVRRHCGVASRSDIGREPRDGSTNDSGFRWRSLEAEYYAWQRGRR